MNLYTSFLSLLLLSGMSVFSLSTLLAQDAIDPAFEIFHVGTLDGEIATPVSQANEFEQWITGHIRHATIDASAEVQDYTSSLVLDPRSGWNYVANWNQGSTEIVIRFQLIQQNEKLKLLEVGSYQACICEGCTELQFSKEMPACECEGGDCLYLMGENLH